MKKETNPKLQKTSRKKAPRKNAPLEELTPADLDKVVGGYGLGDDNSTYFRAIPKIPRIIKSS